MAVVFSEGFESGSNGAAITTGNTVYSTVSGTAVFDSSTRVAGALCGKFTANGTTSAFARHVFAAAVSDRYLRRYFRISNLPASGIPLTLCRLRNSGGTTQAQIVVEATGTINLRDANTTVATSTNAVSPGSWFRTEWHVTTGGTQTLQVYLGNNLNGATPTETISGSYSQGTFDRCEEGADASTYTGTVWVDDVVDDDATWPGADPGANHPPTADAGPDQSVLPWDTVTLDGTGSSDSDGTVTSYSWRQVTGVSVTLSSTTTAQPTFAASGMINGAQLTFGLIVTDDGGLTSAEDIVSITIQPATHFTAKSGAWKLVQALQAKSGSWQ